jgi:hypothetical protein
MKTNEQGATMVTEADMEVALEELVSLGLAERVDPPRRSSWVRELGESMKIGKPVVMTFEEARYAMARLNHLWPGRRFASLATSGGNRKVWRTL